MLKKIIVSICAVAGCLSVSAQPKRVLLDKVIAVVGGASIFYSEVKYNADDVIESRRAQGYTSDRDAMVEVLESIMEQRLLSAQAEIDSVSVNHIAINDQVNAHVESMVKQAGGIAELERVQGMKLYSIRENMRTKYTEQNLAQGMRREVVGDVTISPGEVESFFKSMKPEDIPMIGEQYSYAQITKLPFSKDEANRRVRERLLEMRERVVKGETKFSVLAQMYSVDPGSAFRGGEMPPQPASAFVTPFANALEGLRPGQVSEIVETEFGYHIIELLDKAGDNYHCRHILLRPTYATDELNEPKRFLDSIALAIRSDSLSFEMAAKLHSDDATSKMNGGVVSNNEALQRYNAYDAKLTVTKFLKEDFGTRGYKSIDDLNSLMKLKVGEMSPAFVTEDMVGNQLSKVVKLLEIIPAHRATIEQDYLRLEALALEDKQDRVLKEWLD